MKKLLAVCALAQVVVTSVAWSAPPSDVFFTVMGGFSSCGKGALPAQGLAMYAPLQKMLQNLKTKFPKDNFHYLVSCLGLEAPPTGQAMYLTSDEPELNQMGDSDVVVQQTEQLAQREGGLATFVIGHSYGGWMAMYLDQKLKLSKKLDGLFTIDPIAPSCDPGAIVFADSACFQAPTDFNDGQLRGNTLRWINFYQNQDYFLHSSEISNAENIYLSFRGPHTQIDIDSRTWAAIEAAVTRRLQGL